MFVNEEWDWLTFRGCSKETKSCVLRHKVTGGEERRKLEKISNHNIGNCTVSVDFRNSMKS